MTTPTDNTEYADELDAFRRRLAALEDVGHTERASRKLSAKHRRWLAVVVGVAGAAWIGLGAHRVLSQAGCSQTLPSPLSTFCAGSPAKASEVNANYQQLVDWVEAKVGTVGVTNLDMPGRAALDANAGAVLDSDNGSTPYTRFTVDSLHTEGLGDGQIWIEGYAIDANNTIRIGRGLAGGQSTQATELTSLNVVGGATVNSLVVSSDSMTINGSSLNNYIRSYIRSNCKISIGWRDSCNTCNQGPNTTTVIGVNGGGCVRSDGGSGDTFCSGNWAAIGFDGSMNSDETIYVRFECD